MSCLAITRTAAAALFVAAAALNCAAAEITAAPESVTYTSQKGTVNGLEMTIWTKPTASGGATRIAAAGNSLWFAEHDSGKMVRFTATGAANLFAIPSSGISVKAVVAGKSNDAWFAAFNQGRVGRVTAAGAFNMFSTGVTRNGATGMAVGADDNLWFATESNGIGRTTRTGATRFFPVTDNADQPSAVSVGGDGNIWYVQRKGNEVGRVTPAGNVLQFPAGLSITNDSYGITVGPDGKIWFCDPAGKRIGRMNMDGSGLVYFSAGLSGSPVSIVTGADNYMYFGELEGRIGRISMSGAIKEYPIPGAAGTANFPVRGLTVGPYGNIWFVNDTKSQVGRLRISTASVDCARRVWQDLETCGWPGPGNTGHPSGRNLTPTSGRRITTDGAVIDGERITGGLFIAAKNVVVRNSWITKNGGGASATAVIFIEPGASATIENNTLDGTNSTHSAIWHEGTNVVARRNNMFGINDGVFVWDANNFVLEDNYLHDFTENAANGHIDGFQTEGASHGVIRHNTFDVIQGQTSAIAIWNGRRDSDDILVENNLIAGGGFSVYAEDYHPSEAYPEGGYSVTNIRIFNNKFSKVHFPCVGAYGVWFTRGAPTDGWRRLGNVMLETWQKLDNKNPVVNGWECR